MPASLALSWAPRLVPCLMLCSVLVACSPQSGSGDRAVAPPGAARSANPALSVPAPSAIPGPADAVDEEVATAVAALVADPSAPAPAPVVDRLAQSGDVRQAWILTDRLGFISPGSGESLVAALEELTGVAVPAQAEAWVFYHDLLAGWAVPAPPGYAETKRDLLSAHAPGWSELLADVGALDWRQLTWMGVDPGAVPSLDAPEVTDVAGAGWLEADELVVGVRIGEETRAYPLRVLVVHQVVNDQLGGEPLAVTWCAACRAASVHLARVPVAPGPTAATADFLLAGLRWGEDELLQDRASGSLFDQLAGEALTGPLRGHSLEALPAVLTTWGQWRLSHPDTTVIAADGGVDRVYVPVADPRGVTASVAHPRGPVDGRLDGDDLVLGVLLEGGSGPAGPVAFPSAAVGRALDAGERVVVDGVEVVRLDGGLSARSEPGSDAAGLGTVVEVTWSAWSHRYPTTALWDP